MECVKYANGGRGGGVGEGDSKVYLPQKSFNSLSESKFDPRPHLKILDPLLVGFWFLFPIHKEGMPLLLLYKNQMLAEETVGNKQII